MVHGMIKIESGIDEQNKITPQPTLPISVATVLYRLGLRKITFHILKKIYVYL